MDLELSDKTGVVTGASSGIGRGIARALALEGVRLGIQGRRREQLEELAAEITAAGGPTPIVIVAELMEPGAPETITRAAVQGLGRVDILVNNAGGSRPLELDSPDSAWDEAFTLNFNRPRQLASCVIPGMQSNRWGRIINITGKSETLTLNGAVCAKAAVHAWAKGVSRKVGRDGITVNCVAPGKIMSDQILRNYSPEFRERQAAEDIPVGRYGNPSDMAGLVTYLVSPHGGYITGAVIPVDGGLRRYQF
jgi:3-oxoacyl-[acyl-carrier protein] reductase